MKWLFGFILAMTAAQAPAFQTVILDAGHGGHDRGASPGQSVSEKHLALDVAKRVAEKMKERGIKVVMTRSDDTFVTLDRRTVIANAHPDALFVSIHFNAAWRRGANGFETFYYHPRAASIATRVNNELRTVRQGEERPVLKRGYHVLRKSRIPAILIECGFLTHPQEAALCQKPAYREKLADAIVRGLEKDVAYKLPPLNAESLLDGEPLALDLDEEPPDEPLALETESEPISQPLW